MFSPLWSVYQIFIDITVNVGCFFAPFFINIFCRLPVWNDEFQFEDGLNGFDDFKINGVSTVFVHKIIGDAFLFSAVSCAVVFDEYGNGFSRGGGYVDKEIRKTYSAVGSNGVKRFSAFADVINPTAIEKLIQNRLTVHIRQPVVCGATHVEHRVFRKRYFHFVEDEQQYQLV